MRDGMPTNGYTCVRCQASCTRGDGHFEICPDRREVRLEAENKLQAKRIEALEGAIAYALGRLEPESEGCPNSSELPGALRALADERAAWVEVAVEANKSLAALRATAELVEGG